MLVYWTWRCDLQGRLVTDMDKLDGIVLEVNTTCTDIAHSCLEHMYSLTATHDPILSSRVRLKCGKKTQGLGFPGLLDRLGRRLCLEQTLWESGAVLHGPVRTTSSRSMAQVHYSMYTRKLVRIMSLPPTDLNLFVHVHFQILLWKAAGYLGPLDVSISEYGREIKDGIINFVLVSIKPTVAVIVCNSAAPTTASA